MFSNLYSKSDMYVQLNTRVGYLIIIIKTLSKEAITFDKTTSIYHIYLNIQTIITKYINLQ